MQQSKKSFLFLWVVFTILSNQSLAQQAPPTQVKTAEAVSIEMAPTRIVAAYSKAKFITTIKAESSGRVLELAYIGHTIKQGEPLGLIADDEYELRLNELKSAIASQRAQVEFLKSESVRLKSLESKNLTSGTALDKNKADLKAANADLSQAKSRMQQLENDILKLTPKAPFNAFITKQLAQPGQYLNQGQDLLEIMSSDDIEIIAQIPFKYKAVIQTGQQWQYIDQFGNRHAARVESFIPAATSNSRLIQVHLKNLDDNLLPGEPIQLLVPEALPKDVIAVPRDALVLRRLGAHIFVIRDSLAHKIDVTTGLAQGAMIAVNGEVKAGDQVVVRGNERLRDQQPVQLMQ
ncbi:MAG: efflux RND transporter periplasmic adaptor subunit [Marinicella sp.]